MLNLLKKNLYSSHLCEAFKYVMEREKKNFQIITFGAYEKKKERALKK